MLSLILIIIASLYFPGVIVKVKAFTSGRKGPGILQPWYDIFRLFKKGSVYSTSSSFVFQIGAMIYFSSVIIAALFIPFEETDALFSFTGDFISIRLSARARSFSHHPQRVDVSSGFEGMGANREAFYSLLIEPAFFIMFSALAMFTGYTSFHDIFANLHYDNYFSIVIAMIAGYVLANITLVETSRLPVDDPLTHLELTMVHEVMVLIIAVLISL